MEEFEMNIQKLVRDRYTEGARARQPALCCPVSYDPRFLDAIPEEVLERDYGCGDPSAYVRAGETVLDLGSGGGMICFIASQLVGEKGRVIGVDMTPGMLELARRNAPLVAEKTGLDNVEFRHGHIEDLRTDLDLLDAYLRDHPVASAADYEALNREIGRLRAEQPLVADGSIDVIVSNCVLNLVADTQKRALFAEMFRVLKVGGRIAISDIVSDRSSPPHLKEDEALWSGCISGALQEAEFIQAMEHAGFHGITIDKYEAAPWQVVEGIEYRSITVLAWKGKQGPCVEEDQAVIYRGPWKQVEDDDGHVFARGERVKLCAKTFGLMTREPYASHMIATDQVTAPSPGDERGCAGGVAPGTSGAGRDKCCP
jgi:ubiquinone/menaquinone biosynthesis C-methylase UbiE